MIDGRPDNAPVRASMILAMLSPLIYVFFGVLNLIDAVFDRWKPEMSWIGSLILMIALGGFFSSRMYEPKVDSTPLFGIAAGVGMSMAIILPMAVIRRFLIRRS